MPNLSDKVKLVVATIGVGNKLCPLSAEPEDSPPGEPGRLPDLSFFIRFNIIGFTICFSPLFFTAVGLAGGFTPLTLIISPVLPLGLGGGGCLLGSVGLSDGFGLGIFLGTGGGVVGLATRLGTGEGEGGR